MRSWDDPAIVRDGENKPSRLAGYPRELAITTIDPTSDSCLPLTPQKALSDEGVATPTAESGSKALPNDSDSRSDDFAFIEAVRAKNSRWSNSPAIESCDGDDEQASLQLRSTARNNRIPAVLISMIIHTSLLIAMCLLTLPASNQRGHSLTMRIGETASTESLEVVELEAELNKTFDAANDDPVVVKVETPLQSLTTVPQLSIQPSQSPSQQPDSMGTLSSGGGSLGEGQFRLPTGGGLSGRQPDKRKEIGQKNGATEESEEAVDLALEYLARHQRRNGSWSFDFKLSPCEGECRNSCQVHAAPKRTTPPTAATGLALLAFLGRGYTHENDNPYRENIRRGIYYLRSRAAKSEAGYHWQENSMYAHAIALTALAEALTMTSPNATSGKLVNENAIDYQMDDETLDQRIHHELYPLVDLGANFTCAHQHSLGSWGYVPGRPGDTTMTGWHVLSLIAAKRNGVTLHTNTLSKAKQFLLSVQGKKKFRFGYQGPPAEPTMTAIGLTLMLYLGETVSDTSVLNALTEIAEAGPQPNNIYHNYYASLALHHARHHLWDQWNASLQKQLVTTQEKSGHEKGSWHFDNEFGNVGGRLYTTAMCTLTLEVYYRYMPLYQTRDDEFPL